MNNSIRHLSRSELLPSEWRFVEAIKELGFGRVESLRIARGELVLDPWPTAVRAVKFGSENGATSPAPRAGFELKCQIVELLEYVRATDTGEIRCLEVRHGLPFSMEIEQRPNASGGRRG